MPARIFSAARALRKDDRVVEDGDAAAAAAAAAGLLHRGFGAPFALQP